MSAVSAAHQLLIRWDLIMMQILSSPIATTANHGWHYTAPIAESKSRAAIVRLLIESMKSLSKFAGNN